MHPRIFLRRAYWTGFIFSFNVALTFYIHSSFLVTKIPESFVGNLYTASAIISIIGLFLVPRFIGKFGSRPIISFLIIANVANVAGMIYGKNILMVTVCFVLFFAFNTLIYLGLDMMIERWSDHKTQGAIRGTYLTANSLGFMIAPLVTGYIVDRLGFSALYGFATVLAVPILVFISFRLPSIIHVHNAQSNILLLSRKFLRNSHLRGVFLINFLLQFFYAWMMIYTPIYLHDHVGLPWDKIGILFTIMLSAFVILQYVMGKLADQFHIEKHMMVFGLFVMGIATLFIARAPTVSFAVLAGIMFFTRVGASIVEVMTESYFFKYVHHDDVGSIGFFRNTYPFANIIAPIIASLLLQFMGMWTLFIIIGSICIIAAIGVMQFGHLIKHPR